MASINILPTWNGLGLEQSCTISIFFEREGGKTCDILQTALPFTTSNKVNLIPSVVQIVFSNSLIIHQVKTKKIISVREVWIPGLN